MKWKPNTWKDWEGKDVIIIGGGPSLISFDWHQLIPRKTIGCNDAYQLGPYVCDICVFGDLKWYITHRDRLGMFENPVFTNQPSLHLSSPNWMFTLPRENQGLHTEALGWGSNTGCTAVNLALILGAQRVFLLGFDMKMKDSKTNWHNQNIGTPNKESYVRFQKGFQKIADDLDRVFPGREIFNIGPDSELECFPFYDLDDLLNGDSHENENISHSSCVADAAV